jgi:excinuclease ABC subunit A
MMDVGLGYLSLDRISNTLSGGETQRIHLTRTLSSNLTSSMYILDEPSIGLHPRDTKQLVDVLISLRDLGNTVIVVEHEEEVMRASDHIIDIGPRAGRFGGEVVFAGAYKSFIKKAKRSLTHQYLTGTKKIEVPKTRRPVANKILIKGASQHNLKNIDVTIPLNTLTCVTGISGSGKTTLIKHILYPGLRKLMGEPYSKGPGNHLSIEGDVKSVDQLEMIGQQPLGRSSRSNPVTYVKAYDSIRSLMSSQQASKIRGYQPKHFSFNVDAGRCETCKGDGEIIVEMQFLADVKLVCDECKGKRFKHEVLEVTYQEKNIFDILDMSVDEAIEFFQAEKDIIKKLSPLQDVGLGYVKLGQSSSTLSGGEAQRVKLASFLGKEREGKKILFIFDEPTTGLHFHDIEKLLSALNALVEQGHSVLVIEHNMEVIKCADWVIDLGPEGGKFGGELVVEGTPEEVAACKTSFTGLFLKEKL